MKNGGIPIIKFGQSVKKKGFQVIVIKIIIPSYLIAVLYNSRGLQMIHCTKNSEALLYYTNNSRNLETNRTESCTCQSDMGKLVQLPPNHE